MFTSRLPISTSARRPTNHSDGSTSFVSAHRPSNIPVTARKANLFTPQTKRPFQTGQSTAGKSYLSTGIATEKKYQRPLKPMPDRDNQIRMFNKLVEYMKANAPHLQQPDPKKFFSSVSTTESSRIFEFLISRIIPDFQISRLETDVPEALALLEYPYIRSVTKSALVSVTTRQAVAGLLVIFDWLIDTASYQPSSDDLEEDEENVDLAILKHVRLYPDRVREASQELANKLYSLQDIESRESELKQIAAEREQLVEDTENIEQDYEVVRVLEEDIMKCDEYISQMQKYNETKQKAIEEHKRHTIERLSEETVLKERLATVHAKNKNHPLSMSELEKNQAIIEDLKKNLNDAMKADEVSLRELSKLEESYLAEIEKLRARADEACIVLGEYLKIHDALGGESETWLDIRHKMNEWHLRLQQPLPDDPADIQRLIHEHDRFWEGLEATMPSLESEMQTDLTERNFKLEEKQNAISRNAEESIRLGKAIERISREIETDKCQHAEEMQKLALDIEDESRKMTNLLRDSDLKKLAIQEQLQNEVNVLNNEKKALQEVAALNKEHLQSVVERQRSELETMLRYLEQSCERWQKIKERNELNKQTVVLFHRKLKKRKS